MSGALGRQGSPTDAQHLNSAQMGYSPLPPVEAATLEK